MSDDLSETIREQAAEPAAMAGDTGSVKQRSVAELIEADRYLASKAAARSPRRGLILTRLRPPGAT